MIADLRPYAEYKESGLPWLGQVPAHWHIVRSKRLFTPRKELARPDDLQLSATQAYGVIALNQDMKALIPRPELSVEFFALLLTGIQRELLELVEIAGHGTCCLRTDSWAAFCLPIPTLGEQAAIRSFLSTELATSNAAISRLQREIALLREYRTRLVADIVTGELDVREVATRLPDEAAPDTFTELAGEMLDDADNLDEVERTEEI